MVGIILAKAILNESWKISSERIGTKKRKKYRGKNSAIRKIERLYADGLGSENMKKYK